MSVESTTAHTIGSDTAGFGAIPRYLRGTLSAYEIAVYVALSWRANEFGECIPSVPTIASDAGCSLNTAKRALKSLRDKGLVSWDQRHSTQGDLTSNAYKLAIYKSRGGRACEAPPVGPVGPYGRACEGQEVEPLEEEPIEVIVSAVADGDERPEVEELCNHLADRIEANGSKRPSVTKAWRAACRMMMDRDGRTPEHIRKAIDWCQDDEFWRANILSMPKLRQRYDQLRLQAARKRSDAPAGEAIREQWRAMFAAEGMDLPDDYLNPATWPEAWREN